MLDRGVKSTSNVIKVKWLSSKGLVVVIPPSYTHWYRSKSGKNVCKMVVS